MRLLCTMVHSDTSKSVSGEFLSPRSYAEKLPLIFFLLSHSTELNLLRKFKPLLLFDFDKLNFVGQRGARLVKLKKF